MLLDQNNANHDTVHQTGQTPFELVNTSEHEEVADTLPERNINPSVDYESGRTPFPRLENSRVTAYPGQEEWHNPNAILGHRKVLSQSFTTEPPPSIRAVTQKDPPVLTCRPPQVASYHLHTREPPSAVNCWVLAHAFSDLPPTSTTTCPPTNSLLVSNS